MLLVETDPRYRDQDQRECDAEVSSLAPEAPASDRRRCPGARAERPLADGYDSRPRLLSETLDELMTKLLRAEDTEDDWNPETAGGSTEDSRLDDRRHQAVSVVRPKYLTRSTPLRAREGRG